MKLEKFKVSFDKKDVAYFITFFIMTLVACIFILFNENYRGIGIFGIVFTICAMLVFISSLVFKLEVEIIILRYAQSLEKSMSLIYLKLKESFV